MTLATRPIVSFSTLPKTTISNFTQIPARPTQVSSRAIWWTTLLASSSPPTVSLHPTKALLPLSLQDAALMLLNVLALQRCATQRISRWWAALSCNQIWQIAIRCPRSWRRHSKVRQMRFHSSETWEMWTILRLDALTTRSMCRLSATWALISRDAPHVNWKRISWWSVVGKSMLCPFHS